MSKRASGAWGPGRVPGAVLTRSPFQPAEGVREGSDDPAEFPRGP